MKITVKLAGKSGAATAIKKKNTAVITKIGNAIQGCGLLTQADAKQACPVDTGRLRSSIIYHPQSQFSCNVDTNVEYALFVELGHYTRGHKSFVPAHPFLRPAYEKAVEDFKKEIKDIMKK